MRPPRDSEARSGCDPGPGAAGLRHGGRRSCAPRGCARHRLACSPPPSSSSGMRRPCALAPARRRTCVRPAGRRTPRPPAGRPGRAFARLGRTAGGRRPGAREPVLSARKIRVTCARACAFYARAACDIAAALLAGVEQSESERLGGRTRPAAGGGRAGSTAAAAGLRHCARGSRPVPARRSRPAVDAAGRPGRPSQSIAVRRRRR